MDHKPTVPVNAPPLSEWQTRTLENQEKLIQGQAELADAVNALAAHAETAATALSGMLDILHRLELKL